MKKDILCLSTLIILMSQILLVSASFNFSSGQIIETYSGGEIIKGTFSFKFANHSNANFTSSLGGSISLADLLKNSGHLSGTDYICNPGICKDGYAPINGQTQKEISVGPDKKVYGFAKRPKYNH